MQTENNVEIDLELATFSFLNEYLKNPEYAVFVAEDLLSNQVQLAFRISYSKAILDLIESEKFTEPIESDYEIKGLATMLGEQGIREAIERRYLTPEQVHCVLRHPIGLQVASDLLRAKGDVFKDSAPVDPSEGTFFGGSPTELSVLAASQNYSDRAELRRMLKALLESLVEYLCWPKEAASDGLLDHLCAVSRENEVGMRYRDRVGPALNEWAKMQSYGTEVAKNFSEDQWRRVFNRASLRIVIEEKSEPENSPYFAKLLRSDIDSCDDLYRLAEGLVVYDKENLRDFVGNLWDDICRRKDERFGLLAT